MQAAVYLNEAAGGGLCTAMLRVLRSDDDEDDSDTLDCLYLNALLVQWLSGLHADWD